MSPHFYFIFFQWSINESPALAQTVPACGLWQLNDPVGIELLYSSHGHQKKGLLRNAAMKLGVTIEGIQECKGCSLANGLRKEDSSDSCSAWSQEPGTSVNRTVQYIHSRCLGYLGHFEGTFWGYCLPWVPSIPTRANLTSPVLERRTQVSHPQYFTSGTLCHRSYSHGTPEISEHPSSGVPLYSVQKGSWLLPVTKIFDLACHF